MDTAVFFAERNRGYGPQQAVVFQARLAGHADILGSYAGENELIVDPRGLRDVRLLRTIDLSRER